MDCCFLRPIWLRPPTGCLRMYAPHTMEKDIWVASRRDAIFSKPVEFDGFKIGIVKFFPQTKKLDSFAIAQPVSDHIVWCVTFIPGYIGEADIISIFRTLDRYCQSFCRNGCFCRFGHCCIFRKLSLIISSIN